VAVRGNGCAAVQFEKRSSLSGVKVMQEKRLHGGKRG
jgi:hypothetical protein